MIKTIDKWKAFIYKQQKSILHDPSTKTKTAG